VYLESTEEGVGLYERFGFRILGELEFEARDFGLSRSSRFTVMIWEPEENRGLQL